MINAPVTLLETHLVTVRITEMIEPRPFVKTGGVHYERISLPSADRVAHPPRLQIFRQLSAVGPDLTVYMMAVEHLQHPVLSLNDLEIPRTVLNHEQTWYSQRITVPLGIVSQCGRNGSRSVRWQVRLEFRFSPRRLRRRFLAQGKHSIPSQPDSRKVVRIKRKRRRGARGSLHCAASLSPSALSSLRVRHR